MFDSLPFQAVSEIRAIQWQPGLADSVTLHGEVFVSSRDAAGAALALALELDRMRAAAFDPLVDMPDNHAWLWVQDAGALRLTGRPYFPGLPASLRHRLVHVTAPTSEDALFALEEGLHCCELAFVIGEIAGNPKVLDFTASRRLSLAAERYGVPLWLVRIDAKHDLSSARMRWNVQSAPSPPPRWNAAAPGPPSWRADLFRARNHPPGKWILRDDADVLIAANSPDHGNLAASAGDRPLAAR